ncbi:xanthine dehydrogenase accessory factor [Lachnospiraceae bacterium PF1-21]|uniref:Selenium-dependent molybdenum cofactor biosynthesis protein YqeB n=1 Tax=Ohessyouella blattaphilus TaxID=2949333 RepID=A0ABT1EKB3_9FIRM|nr:selenium-dependent molybdenum cofactor biosynthesis protein YqeB [Ohessyouella blattaphilus]MCP1111135.1 selenium-dependent molybdenum cofactor biosynthesis protein YqeB [Ohessyouella blattaphilus]MCR8564529.1 selenium-dependent molybdenum cofactor biosynthesis protein YqeB [Ohessyouella blattaphilus]
MRKLLMNKEIICVRGAGDLATGVIQKLARSGFRVYALEIERPTTIRRQVALSTAMAEGEAKVEDICGRRVEFSVDNLEKCWQQGVVPLLTDKEGETTKRIKPAALVDAILAKRNLGTKREMAPITIGLGPGFVAGEDVDVVIETMRGHDLGRLISEGAALADTGMPGEIGGQGRKRVIHAPIPGCVHHIANIGDYVEAGAPLLKIDEQEVCAPFSGVLRGLIQEGMEVPAKMKIADLDPRRLEDEQIYRISDKARCIGGAVLEAILYLQTNQSK